MPQKALQRLKVITMRSKLRIGILGGSFDPVHWGHILLAREALSFANLDVVLFLVAKDPPHKTVFTPAIDRFQMACLATEKEPGISVCDLELKMPGKNYAIYSIRELKRRFPGAELFYLVGSDVLMSLPYWYGSDELISLVKILCVMRNQKLGLTPDHILRIQEQYHVLLRIMDVRLPAISSTEIRGRIQRKESISNYVPMAVENYILAHDLYR